MLLLPVPSPAFRALPPCRWWLALGCSCSAWERSHGRLATGWGSLKRSALACSCLAYLSCVLLSALLTCSSHAFPLFLYRLKLLTGSKRRRTRHTSWGSGRAVCRRTARSVPSTLERHLRPLVAAAQLHAACGLAPGAAQQLAGQCACWGLVLMAPASCERPVHAAQGHAEHTVGDWG